MTLNDGNIWTNKGETLSDKSVRKEYKLTQDEILKAINNGKLRYQVNYIYDNPWFRLLRTEVEKLVEELQGKNYLKLSKAKTELNQVNKELKELKTKIRNLESRKDELLNDIKKNS